jgi:acetyl-CoA synthetase
VVVTIGRGVLPMFSGFGADAIAQRVTTVERWPSARSRDPRVVASRSVRIASSTQALAHCPGVRQVVVLHHLAAPHDWTPGRDHWWDELTAGAPNGVAEVATESMPSDDPFLLMFTSGTSGKPKGVVHSHCGFPIKTALDLSICMDLKAGDRFLWMSDMGGWSDRCLLVFGGLLVTVVLAEGVLNYPQPDRLWRLVERHRVTCLGLAPRPRAFDARRHDHQLARAGLDGLFHVISP